MSGFMSGRVVRYAIVVLSVSAATTILSLVSGHVSIPTIELLYVPPVLMVAVVFGTRASLAASLLAVVEYDFFIIRPHFEFNFNRVGVLLALTVLAAVAVTTSQLAGRARDEADRARRRAYEMGLLYRLSRALTSIPDTDRTLQVITDRVCEVFGSEWCSISVRDPEGALQVARTPANVGPIAGRNGEKIVEDLGRDTVANEVVLPLETPQGVVGVLTVGPRLASAKYGVDERRLLSAFAAQAALAVARLNGEEVRRRLRVAEESDRLKTALLNAVSHDLRTPLASIKASASALLLGDYYWTHDDREEMLQAIDAEADRLNRLVGHLLDMSRIEAGVLRPVLDEHEAGALADAVERRVRPLLGDRFTVSCDGRLPLIQIDALRIEELLVNLVENAMKYATPDTSIELSLGRDEEDMVVSVVDHGPGIPLQQREAVFEPFLRLPEHADRSGGAGLGLAIGKSIVEMHGGSIVVAETPGGGTTVVVRLPLQHGMVAL